MIHFTTQQLEIINDWEPLEASYGRDNEAHYILNIKPIVDRLVDLGYTCETRMDSGLGTYHQICISHKPLETCSPHRVFQDSFTGFVNFSLLGPWCTLETRSGLWFEDSDNEFLFEAKKLIDGSIFKILTKSECDTVVPQHIKPIDYGPERDFYTLMDIIFQSDD